MTALFIHYPKCSTCKKALNYLQEGGLNPEERHIVEDVPTQEELIAWIEKSGLEFKKFFNTSGILYREMGLKDRVKDMSLEEATALLATNGMLIKRPLLITDDAICVGFKEDNYKRVLESNN